MIIEKECAIFVLLLIFASQILIFNKLNQMSASLDQLTQDVTNQTTVTQSAITLLGNLKTSLDAAIAANANGDDSQLTALSQQLEAQQTALTAAITANTPAATEAPDVAPSA